MSYHRICISSGHSTKCQGAIGILNEVEEATRVVDRVADELRHRGVDALTFHDTVSTTQNENLNRIVDWHNSHTRDLDISVHFNAFEYTQDARGTECWYYSQQDLAARVSRAIADAGDLIDRGAKYSNDLFVLTHTEMPCLLFEICFVDSEADARNYKAYFDRIIEAIADVLGGAEQIEQPPPDTDASISVTGKVSWFGGPNDDGVDEDEGLAFIYDIEEKPELFLPEQPADLGLARKLNPHVHYLAMRWNYEVTPREMLKQALALVRNPRTGFALTAMPADWGPHESTGRIADLSPGLMQDLGLVTDDIAEITFPHREVVA